MISINSGSSAKMTDRPVASVCSLGVSRPEFIVVTDLSGAFAVRLGSVVETGVNLLPGRRVNDPRGTKAVAAGATAAEAQATAYALAAATAEPQQQMKHQHKMWAFRGLEPWSDPV